MRIAVGLIVIATAALGACGGDDAIIDETCDEVQAYQLVTPGKKVEAPEGLDDLESFKEMPLPKAQTPPRPEGARCIDSVPSVITDEG